MDCFCICFISAAQETHKIDILTKRYAVVLKMQNQTDVNPEGEGEAKVGGIFLKPLDEGVRHEDKIIVGKDLAAHLLEEVIKEEETKEEEEEDMELERGEREEEEEEERRKSARPPPRALTPV